jgi:VanZ family protein
MRARQGATPSAFWIFPFHDGLPGESRAAFETVNNRYPPWLVRASWFAVILWASTIYCLSSLSGPEIEQIGVRLWDKAAHFLAFFTGAVLLTSALRFSTAWSWLWIGVLAGLAIAIFGATDEYHQLFTPNRSGGDLLDWLADALGGIVGVTFTILTHACFQRSNRPAPTGN